MDGVERIMVLGIFAVIVAILGVAAWSVTQDSGLDPVGATDGGALTASTRVFGTPLDRPGVGSVSERDKQRQAQRQAVDDLLGRGERGAGKKPSKSGQKIAKGGSGRVVPQPTGASPERRTAAGAPLHLSAEAETSAQTPSAQTLVRPRGTVPGVVTPMIRPQAGQAGTPASRSYTVQEGDSFWAIARSQCAGQNVKLAAEAIQRLNPGKSTLTPGDVIQLPARQAGRQTAAVAAESGAPRGYRYYIVQSGDRLSRIAMNELGSSSRTDELFELNSDTLESPDALSVGQRLLLPVD
ncbi:MAG: hypothetical protein DRQ55_09040 [Planctomycetota bacterium]|nr:MAG: hypothetical protein DRQ55_09040 [Planctomycetota bacterium]